MILSRNSTKKRLVQIFKTNTIWRTVRSSDLRLIKSDKSTRPDIVPEIQELAQKLAEVANVKRVRAVAPRFPDLHNIDFELELQPETELSAELSYEVWEQVQNIVIDYEWKLRDDSGEKWYFHAEVVSKLSLLRDTSKVIVDSHNRQRAEVIIRTWSSPPLKLVEH
ncbi:hypothetical protein [Nostoc sp.]|uniref:hypothetical protein n=1 Tax=Nostoc sp. TaxID=1180 RepID=UPI002FFBBF0F